MNKEKLRELYKKRRKGIIDTNALSEQIFASLLKRFTLTDQLVSIFLPIERFKEINTYILLDNSVFKANYSVSISDMKSCEMEHVLYEGRNQIEVNSWGIPEPKSGEIIGEDKIDIVLVPLLIVDYKGNRVGYGKGFYDRFLKNCRPGTLKIGLSYFEPIPELIETNKDDFPLNYCVTPTQVYEFK